MIMAEHQDYSDLFWISNKNTSSQNISNALKNVIQTSQTVGKLLVEKASMIDFGSKI